MSGNSIRALFRALAERDAATADRILTAHPEYLTEKFYHEAWLEEQNYLLPQLTPLMFLLTPEAKKRYSNGDWIKENAEMVRVVLRHIEAHYVTPEGIDPACAGNGKKSVEDPLRQDSETIGDAICLAAFHVPEVVPDMLRAGFPAVVEAGLKEDYGPLGWAIYSQSEHAAGAIHALAAAGADVNRRYTSLFKRDHSPEQLTPLLMALKDLRPDAPPERGNPYYAETAKALLEAGANPNTPDNGGVTPLEHALEKRSDQAVLDLIAHGADLHEYYADLSKGPDEQVAILDSKTGPDSPWRTVDAQTRHLSATLDATAPYELQALLLTQDGMPTSFALQLGGVQMLGMLADEERWNGAGRDGVHALETLARTLPPWLKAQLAEIDLSALRRQAQEEATQDTSFRGRFARAGRADMREGSDVGR